MSGFIKEEILCEQDYYFLYEGNVLSKFIKTSGGRDFSFTEDFVVVKNDRKKFKLTIKPINQNYTEEVNYLYRPHGSMDKDGIITRGSESMEMIIYSCYKLISHILDSLEIEVNLVEEVLNEEVPDEEITTFHKREVYLLGLICGLIGMMLGGALVFLAVLLSERVF